MVIFVPTILWAQSLNTVFPWAEDLQDIELGMPIDEFRDVRQNAEPLVLFGEDKGLYGPEFNGNFNEKNVGFPVDNQNGVSSYVMYSFSQGKLYFVITELNLEEDLLREVGEWYRKMLWNKHGSAKIGHSPMIIKDRVYKGPAEIFKVDEMSAVRGGLKAVRSPG